MLISMFDFTDEKTMLMQLLNPTYFDRLKESADILGCAKRCFFQTYLGYGSPDGEAYEFKPTFFGMTLTGGFGNYDYTYTPQQFVKLVEEIFDEELDYEQVFNERRQLKYAHNQH